MTSEPAKDNQPKSNETDSPDSVRIDDPRQSSPSEAGLRRPTIEELEAEIRAGDDDTQAKELAFARRALEMLPDLSEDQVNALRRRIHDGYYDNPKVTRILTQRLAELFGDPDSEDGDASY